jgi:hypothetical protein
MANGPNEPLSAVRYVSTNEASGLLLRQSAVGVAFGHFRWVNAAELGRIWVPQHRVFELGALTLLTESVADQELRRYIARRANFISESYHHSARPLIKNGLDSIKTDLNADHLSPRLWPRLLSGIEKKAVEFGPDSMDLQTAPLDRALAVFSAVEQSSGAVPIVADQVHGQLQYENQEILVWKSPLYDCQKMSQILKALSVEHPNEPQLLVIGGGRAGHTPPGRIKPDRAVNYSEIPDEGHFTSVRSRHVFWRPVVDVENCLTDENTTLVQKRAAILTQLAVA